MLAMIGGAMIVIGGIGPIAFMVRERKNPSVDPAAADAAPATVGS